MGEQAWLMGTTWRDRKGSLLQAASSLSMAFSRAQVSSGVLGLETPVELEVIKEEVGNWSVCWQGSAPSVTQRLV